MDELGDYNEDYEHSFEFGGDHNGDYGDSYADALTNQAANIRQGGNSMDGAMSSFDSNRINFDNSDFFEALEMDYVDALEENIKKPSTIRFVEKNDLIDDVVIRSKNLSYQAPDETFLDIFDENNRDVSPTGDGSYTSRYPLCDDDDDESITDDFTYDEDSMEEDSEERKVLKRIFYSAGGAAFFAGLGFVSQRLMGFFQKSDDLDPVGGNYNGPEHAVTSADAAADAAHGAEVAADAAQAAKTAMEASLHVSFDTSSTSLATSGAAATGTQGAAAAQ